MAVYNKAVLFYNKKSGQSKKGNQQELIRSHFKKHNIDLEIIIATQPQKEFEEIVSKAIDQGVDLFLAAGGDGTVSFVASHLVGKDKPLGILPLGTGNLLSKELNIPQRLDKALELITSDDHETLKMDTIKFDGRDYIANISVGVTPKMIEQTETADKQRYGILAYLANFVQQILGLELQRFYLEYDGKTATHTASEILITNSRTVGVEAVKWSEDVSITDGILDLFVIRAANIFDILSLLSSIFAKNEKKSPVMKTIQIEKYCRIETPKPISIQADGDIVGKTPAEIKVNPSSLKIIVGHKNHKLIN